MSLFTVPISLFLAALLLLTFWIRKKFSYWAERGFDFIKPEFPFGNLKDVGYKVHYSKLSRYYYESYKNKAAAIGLYFFTQPVVFLMNLDVIKSVLVKHFHIFHDRGLYANSKGDPLIANLFSIEGAEWKRMRAKLTPTFTSGKMKMTFTTVLEICEEMINYISEHESVVELEMKDIIARFMTDVIANVAFGLEVNSMRNPHAMFREMGRRVFNPPKWQLMKLSFVMVFSKLARKFNIRVLERAVADFFMSTFTETMNYREKNNVKRNDFFNLLLELKNHEEEHERLTVNELAAQAFVFFLAGFETSSTVMTFALYELALNPDIQERLREEIKMILARHENQITYGAMMEMTYMEMVIDEVLRMYPPATLLLRVARDDYQIPGTELTIEKDTLVIIPIYAIQRDADIYENPEKFDPERFSEENKAKRHAMAFLAFGHGNRNCIGGRFAHMQLKIGLIKLLLNFKFSPSPYTTIPMDFAAHAQMLSPINDMWLNVERTQ